MEISDVVRKGFGLVGSCESTEKVLHVRTYSTVRGVFFLGGFLRKLWSKLTTTCASRAESPAIVLLGSFSLVGLNQINPGSIAYVLYQVWLLIISCTLLQYVMMIGLESLRIRRQSRGRIII